MEIRAITGRSGMRIFFCLFLLLVPGRSECLEALPREAVGWIHADNDLLGTGFLIDLEKKRMLSCYHCVGEAKGLEVFFPVRDKDELLADKNYYLSHRTELRKSGHLIPGKVIRKSLSRDLALIELAELPPSAQKVSFASRAASPSESIRTVGHRYDAESLWNVTQGVLRQSARQEGYFWQGQKLAQNAHALFLQLPVNTGDSGGPLLNSQNQVIGITSAVRWRTGGIAIGIGWEEIRSFLDQPASDSPTTKALYEAVAQSTLWVNPAATEFRHAGFLVDAQKGWILTTSKAVEGLEKTEVVFLWPMLHERAASKKLYEVPGTVPRYTVRVRKVDLVRDLALLELEAPLPSRKAVTLAIKEPAVTDRIHSINHPLGVDCLWLYSQGNVRQKTRLTVEKPEAIEFRVLLLQMPTQGSSPGGPVYNDAGEVVGLVLNRESAQQQIGYAITAAEIREFLKEKK